jgi:hypothetical protein
MHYSRVKKKVAPICGSDFGRYSPHAGIRMWDQPKNTIDLGKNWHAETI